MLIVIVLALFFSLGLYVLNKNCQKSDECVGEEQESIEAITIILLEEVKITIPIGLGLVIILFFLDYYLTVNFVKGLNKQNEVKKGCGKNFLFGNTSDGREIWIECGFYGLCPACSKKGEEK